MQKTVTSVTSVLKRRFVLHLFNEEIYFIFQEGIFFQFVLQMTVTKRRYLS